jgi:preprotein translocase subunit SecD
MTFTVLCEVLIILGIASSSDYLVWGIALVANMAVVIFAFLKKQEIDALAWIGALLIPLLGILVAWTVDLSAIGGIIATIGTGVDHLIIITDETMRKKEEAVYTFKEKIKAAFFMVFGAASTVIAAMVPLLFLGIGLVKGFAITTIIGVLVGILITRPAYANIVEALHRREEKKSAAATA